MAVGLESGHIKIVDMEQNEVIKILKGHSQSVTSLVWDNNILYSASNDMSVKIWGSN
jgi:WD40 repeat protein